MSSTPTLPMPLHEHKSASSICWQDVFSELCEYDEPMGGRQGLERRRALGVQAEEFVFAS